MTDINNPYKAQVRFLFRTPVKIKIPAIYPDSFFDELFSILEKVDRLYNSYTPDSYIDRINKHAGTFVAVDETTVRLLGKVGYLSDLFNGVYDITIMPLLRLWGFYEERREEIPSKGALKEVLKRVDYRRIEIREGAVKIDRDQEITTGSFIKSFAIDCLMEELRKRGINDVMVNAGGSAIATINSFSHPSWKVIVKEPEGNTELFTVHLSDACLSTSCQLSGAIDKSYGKVGHILHPRHGYPGINRQVGIVADDCLTADVFSTALCNWPARDFSRKMKELSETFSITGYMIGRDGEVIFANEYEKLITYQLAVNY